MSGEVAEPGAELSTTDLGAAEIEDAIDDAAERDEDGDERAGAVHGVPVPIDEPERAVPPGAGASITGVTPDDLDS